MKKSYLASMSAAALVFLLSIAQAKDPIPSCTVPGSSGIAAHYNSVTYNPAYNSRTFDALSPAHFSLVRYVPDWQNIEKQKGSYDFTTVDWLTSAFTSRGLRPVLCLGLNNPLYKVNARIKTQEQREAFGRFVRAMVRHYRGKKVIWEIWNEPNVSAFWPVSPAENLTLQDKINEYLAMLNYVVPIIRQEDPEALVIGPGAANYNTAWLRDALSLGLLNQLDGLSVHPYQGTQRPELVIAQYEQVRGWTPSPQRSKPIFFTEWGYSTGVGGTEVSQQKQADYAQRQYMLSLMLGIKGNFIYSLTDASLSAPCLTANACYGLFTKASGSIKPAYNALMKLNNQLLGYQFSKRVTYSDPTVYMLEFKGSRSTKYAVWCSTDGKKVNAVLPNKQTVLANNSVQVF